MLVSYFLFLFLAMAGLGVSLIGGQSIADIIIWIAPLLFIPFFFWFFSLYNKTELLKGVVYSGYVFSITILVVFILLLVYGQSVTDYFNSFPGWFYVRDDGYPQVYFQSTLVMVAISLYSFFSGYRKSAFFFVFLLGLCLSRFGVFTVLFFMLMAAFFKKETIAKFIRYLFLPQAVLVLLAFVMVYLPYSNLSIIDDPYDGISIRLGHLVSVFNNLDGFNILFGMGPGSHFYSIGFNSFTDNIEISQLEIIRKYGVLGYLLHSLAFFYILILFYKRERYQEIISLYGFYLVSYSNPVLVSFTFSVFLGLLMAISLNKKKLTHPLNIRFS
ncbi:hypothetical protein [Leminorella grimontii]|nr:hypothetical protein [Leminorella grimontii]